VIQNSEVSAGLHENHFADLAVVHLLAGHSSSETTTGYDRRSERAKQDAVIRLHMAWTRRFT